MRMEKTVLAGSMLAVISSVTLAQEAPLTGTVTTVDRVSSTVTIQQAQSGTVGAAGAAGDQYKVQGSMLTTLHAGDKVSFSVTETGGVKTITKLEKQ